MIKKSILLTVALLSTLSGTLSSDKYRMGFSLGISHNDIKVKSVTTKEHIYFVKNAPILGVFCGIDHFIDKTPLFLGFELEARNHNYEKEEVVAQGTTDDYFSLRLRTNNSVKGALRFGIVSDDTLLYAKTGLHTYNLQSTACLLGEPDSIKKESFQKIGYIGGFGIEGRLNPNFSLGLEHEFAFGSEFKLTYHEEVAVAKPLTQITKLKLTYNF